MPKTSKKEVFFWVWLVSFILVFLVTAFLPIILSIANNNWIYFVMYHWIMVPIFFEVVIWVVMFKLFLE